MLEARAHKQLKSLLRQSSYPWPHNLTLSRLVARSLRRGDNTLIQIAHSGQDSWWLGLLIPLCLKPAGRFEKVPASIKDLSVAVAVLDKPPIMCINPNP